MSAANWKNDTFTRWVDADRSLPSLSPVTSRLIELASNDAASVADIADLIAKDPSLTTRVLRLANSAFFSTLCAVTTIRQAVLRIGIQQTRLLALSLSLKDTFPMGKVGAVDYARFWRLSLYQGLLARALAHHLKTGDPEEAFTAGFTLEIGLLVLVRMPAEAKDIPIGAEMCALTGLLESEREWYGVDHREVGEYVLRRWNFPDAIVACQRSHEYAVGSPGAPLVRICAMASELSAFVCGPGPDFQEVFDRMKAIFGLDRSLVSEIVAGVLEQVDGIAESLQLAIDGAKDALDLMEKANLALTRLSQRFIDHQCGFEELPSFETLQGGAAERTRVVKETLEAVEHEIRNPLTVVGGFTRRLAKGIDPESSEWKYVQMILSETERLEQALKGLGAMIESE